MRYDADVAQAKVGLNASYYFNSVGATLRLTFLTAGSDALVSPSVGPAGRFVPPRRSSASVAADGATLPCAAAAEGGGTSGAASPVETAAPADDTTSVDAGGAGAGAGAAAGAIARGRGKSTVERSNGVPSSPGANATIEQ